MNEANEGTPQGRDSSLEAYDATRSVIECLEKISIEAERVAAFDAFPPQHPLAIELGECITAYVQAVRQLGKQPEAAVILLKGLIRDHLHVNEFAKRSLTEDVIRWVITGYYGQSRSPE